GTPVGGIDQDHPLRRRMGPSPCRAAAREHKRVHLASLDHAEFEILVEWCVRNRMPVVHAEASPSLPRDKTPTFLTTLSSCCILDVSQRNNRGWHCRGDTCGTEETPKPPPGVAARSAGISISLT